MEKQILDLKTLKQGQIIKVDELGKGVFFALVTSVGQSKPVDSRVLEKKHVKENNILYDAFKEGGIIQLSFIEFNENGRKWTMSLNTIGATVRFISPNDCDYNFSFFRASTRQAAVFLKSGITDWIPKAAKREFETFLKSYEILLKSTK